MKKNKKILLCNDLLVNGGAEILLQIITKGLINRGYDVTIMCRWDALKELKNQKNSRFPSNTHFITDRYPTRKYKKFPPMTVINFMIRKAYRLMVMIRIALKNYDTAVAMLEGHLMKDVASLRAKRKFAWIQCDYERFQNEDRCWKYFANTEEQVKCMKRFNKIVCVSKSLKEGVIRAVGDTGNLCVRYNPIDVKEILELSKKSSNYVKDSSKKLIVSVGRLHETKNFKTLLEACYLLNDKDRFDLWIIGDGPQKEELTGYIRDRGLTNVKLLGYQSNPYPMIKQADMFISTSITESYGLAVQEALILGVPVIAVKNPGIIESLDPEFGILVENSPESISQAVYGFLSDPVLLNMYRIKIKEKFNKNSLYEDRIKKICDLIGR